MAKRYRISCINKADRNNPNKHITHIGGVDTDNKRWKITEKAAIQYIENCTFEFYVYAGGSSVNVIVATSSAGNKYLRTVADGEIPDNLLSLPECP